jgi:hypothetical protein
MPITQQELELLTEAVDIVVVRERQKSPDYDDVFWAAWRDILLAEVIKRREEILA